MLLVLASGCDDDYIIATGSLLIEPEEIVFSKPDAGQTQMIRQASLRNVGAGPLQISSVRVTENDESLELELLDADDWNEVREIEAGDEISVSIGWNVTNAQPDLGELTVVHNAGEPTVAVIETPDVDPFIRVETQPLGQVDESSTTVVLDRAPAGGFQRVRIAITSDSVASLELEHVCLLDADGNCKPPLEMGSDFILCLGDFLNPGECSTEMPDRSIGLFESLVYSVFYIPTADSEGGTTARVSIASNASRRPTYEVIVQGIPCVRLEEGDTCSGCGDGVQGLLEECDDGNLVEQDGCRNDCTLARCGDGIVHVGEEVCDDGNFDEADECTSLCAPPICGDGLLQPGEACDEAGRQTAECEINCTIPSCGDGISNLLSNEECDDGNDIETDD